MLKLLVEIFSDYLASQGIQANDVGDGLIMFECQGESGAWHCHVSGLEDSRVVMVYSVCPFTVAPEGLAAMSEFIDRANFGMVVGNFEMDHSDGELRFRTSMSLGAAQLDANACNQLLGWNLTIMDHYLPALMEIVGGATDILGITRKLEADMA